MEKHRTSVIIVAAGSSVRMGVNKILLPLGDTNVIGQTLRAFEACDAVQDIVAAARPDDFEAIRQTAAQCGITKLTAVTAGGSTRQESVFACLRLISKETDYIAIHDGARPLVQAAQIDRVIRDAAVFGGAVLGVPVKDTIKVVEDGLVVDTPYRPSLYITQTPQVFRRQAYFEAVTFAKAHSLDFTDDCQLFESINQRVYMTCGDYTNIKITTPEDIAIAELLLARRREEQNANRTRL